MKYRLLIALLALSYNSFGQVHDLPSFIGKAKNHNLAVMDFQYMLRINELDSHLLRASLRTQLNFISDISYAPLVNGLGYDEAITNIANVSAFFQVRRIFLSRNYLGEQQKTLSIQRKALLDTLLLSRLDQVRMITDQYINAYSDQLTMDYNQQVYELMKGEEKALNKLTETGVYKQTDYLSFYITLQQQELNFLQSQMQYNNDYLTLNLLAGIADTAIEKIDPPVITDTIPVDFYNSWFNSIYSNDSLRIENERALTHYLYRPRLGAYADAGYVSSLNYQPYKNFGASAGISFVVPLYDGHQQKLRYDKLALYEKARTDRRSFYFNRYQVQTMQLRKQMEGTLFMISKIEKQIEFAYALLLANNKLLETGDIVMKDYVSAINNYLDARNLMLQNTILHYRLQSQVSYYQPYK